MLSSSSPLNTNINSTNSSKQNEAIKDPELLCSNVIKLDVGGKIYKTTRTTLTRYPNSMLGAMFSGRHKLQRQDDGSIFIDADPDAFGHLLYYLRRGKLPSELNSAQLDAFWTEVKYFQLELTNTIQASQMPPSPQVKKNGNGASNKTSRIVWSAADIQALITAYNSGYTTAAQVKEYYKWKTPNQKITTKISDLIRKGLITRAPIAAVATGALIAQHVSPKATPTPEIPLPPTVAVATTPAKRLLEEVFTDEEENTDSEDVPTKRRKKRHSKKEAVMPNIVAEPPSGLSIIVCGWETESQIVLWLNRCKGYKYRLNVYNKELIIAYSPVKPTKQDVDGILGLNWAVFMAVSKYEAPKGTYIVTPKEGEMEPEVQAEATEQFVVVVWSKVNKKRALIF